jgi:hypothetical protein
MRRTLTLGVTAVLLTACASSGPAGSSAACRPVGTESGVSIFFEDGVLPASGQVDITACVDGECRSHVASVAEPNAFVPVLPTPPDADVQVKVTVLSGMAKKLFDGETAAHTHAVELQGAHCTSPAGQVNVIAHKDGSLTVAP